MQKLIIVSGPAGSGKNTVCERLMENFPSVGRIVTSTSRAPRGAEQNGVDYNFFSRQEFEDLISKNAFYEYALVHGNYYGTLKRTLDEGFKSGKDLVLIIDVQGAHTWTGRIASENPDLKERMVSVFIMPPSIDELKKRLHTRGTEDEAQIARRMETAISEMKRAGEFDFVINSKTKDEDYAALREIYLKVKTL